MELSNGLILAFLKNYQRKRIENPDKDSLDVMVGEVVSLLELAQSFGLVVDNDEANASSKPDPDPDPDPDPEPVPEPPPFTMDDINLSLVNFIGDPAGIQNWPITHSLQAYARGNDIFFDQVAVNLWPKKTFQYRNDMVANLWVAFFYNDKYYAASVEWFGAGIKTRSKNCVSGGGIKKFNIIPESWRPKKGDAVYLCVAACSRGKQGGKWMWERPPICRERTPFVKFEWPW